MRRDLTQGSVLKNVVLFSLPYLLSYFLQTLYGMADLFIIGQFRGVESTTAVSVGSQVMHMLTVMLVGLAMGATVSIGQAVGGGDHRRASRCIGNTVTLFMGLSVVLTGVLLCITRPIVAVMSTPAEAEAPLNIVELESFREILVGGRTFTALASQTLSLKELSAYPLISLSEESMTRAFYRQFFLEHDAVLRPDTEAATTDQMLTLVRSELGLAFVPEPMTRNALKSREIVQLTLREEIPARSVCLVYDRHRPLNTAARAFRERLQKG